MNNEWIIDVLADVRKFACEQAMLDLAEHLDDAILVAAMELRKGGQTSSGTHERENRSLSTTFTDNGYIV